VSAYWPGGVRHVGGASPVCGVRAELEKARADTARCGGRQGEPPPGADLEVASEYLVPGVLADRLVVAGKVL